MKILSRHSVVTGQKLAYVRTVYVHAHIPAYIYTYVRTYLPTYIHTHVHTYVYIGTGIFVYVFNTAFETRLDSCRHSVGGFFLIVCTYFSLTENRNKGNGNAFVKLDEEDLVLIDWIGFNFM
jgi:hypothetical protein